MWIPVENPAGQLYDFSGTSSSKRAYSTTDYREPDVVTGASSGENSTSRTKYDNVSSNYTNAKIKDKNGNDITTASQFKEQLQEEFNEMKERVKRYKGFYIGRYETGNLSQSKAVVQKNNSDINKQNWYTR